MNAVNTQNNKRFENTRLAFLFNTFMRRPLLWSLALAAIVILTLGVIWERRTWALTFRPWLLIEIEGEEVTGTRPLLRIEGGELSGHTFCENLEGSYTRIGHRLIASEITADPSDCTHKAEYRAALEGMRRYQIKDDLLYVYYEGGDSPLVFQRAWPGDPELQIVIDLETP